MDKSKSKNKGKRKRVDPLPLPQIEDPFIFEGDLRFHNHKRGSGGSGGGGSSSSIAQIHHQGVATGRIPLPLNKVIQGWNNVPKLYQYLPKDIQVVYHRRTGEDEVATSKGSKQNHVQEGEEEDKVEQGDLMNNALDLEVTVGWSSHEETERITVLGNGPLISHPQLELELPINHVESTIQPAPPLIEEHRSRQLFDSGYQAVPYSKDGVCQTDKKISPSSIGCQTEEEERLPQTTSCSIKPSISSSSQTHCPSSSTVQVQTESLSLPSHPCHSCEHCSSRDHETGESSQSSIPIPTNKSHLLMKSTQSQTEIDIETPKICLSCDFKQLELTEVEETLTDVKRNLRRTESELESVKEQLLRKPNVRETGTNPTTEYKEVIQENEQLKRALTTLQSKLNSYQNGLTRLRTAIEKPINGIDDKEVIKVVEKAEDFLAHQNHTHSKVVKKIDQHMNTLQAYFTNENV